MRIRNQRLPIGYREVEYLEFTGTQYVDTGFSGSNGVKIIGSFSITSLPNSGYTVIGAHNVTSPYARCYVIAENNRWNIGYGKGYTASNILQTNVVYNFQYSAYPDSRGMSTTINGTNITAAYDSNFTNNGGLSTLNLLIGTQQYTLAHDGEGLKGYIYKIKIYNQNGVDVRNFIPCLRTSDSKPGMYDTVNSVFYTNAGTGEFLYGPYSDSYKLNLYPRLPSAYQEVEYIEAGSGQYIASNLNFYHTSTLEIYGKSATSSSGTRACIASEYNNGCNLSLEVIGYLRLFNDGYPDFSNYGYVNGSPQEYAFLFNRDIGTMTTKCNGVTETRNGVYGNSVVPFYIFVDRAKRFSVFNKTHKLYYLKMIKDGKEYCNLIPCYRKSDNEIGLFDLVNQVFYTNQGTGTFGKGNNVNNILHLTPKSTLIPLIYQEVDYIQTTGTQYIDTGLSLPDGFKLKTKLELTADASETHPAYGMVLFGSWDTAGGSGYNYNYFIVNRFDSKCDLGFGDTHEIITAFTFKDILYEIETSNIYDNRYVTINGSQNLAEHQQGDSNYSSLTMILFGLNLNSSITPSCYCKLYNFKVYDKDDVLVRDFIPCYRKSDTVIGLWDAVHGKFYTNNGTGVFLKGADKNPETR